MTLSVSPRRCRSIKNVSHLVLVLSGNLNSSIHQHKKRSADRVEMTTEICNSEVFLYQISYWSTKIMGCSMVKGGH